MGSLTQAWPALLLLIVTPVVMAAILRACRLPGWRVAGGLLAGLVLGPSILGAAWTDQYEQWFVGGASERQAVEIAERGVEADQLAAQEAKAPEESRQSLQTGGESELDRARTALNAARWRHQAPMRWLIATIIAAMLLGAGLQAVPRRGAESAGAIISIGLGALLIPAGIVFFLMHFVWEQGLGTALLVAAAAGIGPWALGAVDREAADQAEHDGARLLQSAGRFASIVAIAATGAGVWLIRGWEGLVWMVPLLALPLGWLLPSMRGWPVRLFDAVLIPIVAASAVLHVNLFEQAALWPALVVMLVSADGRWLGAFIGAMLPGGRTALRTMRLVLGSMAAGPTQLAITALAAHAFALSGELAFALALGALMIEVTTPARRGMASRIIEIEEEIDQLEDEI